MDAENAAATISTLRLQFVVTAPIGAATAYFAGPPLSAVLTNGCALAIFARISRPSMHAPCAAATFATVMFLLHVNAKRATATTLAITTDAIMLAYGTAPLRKLLAKSAHALFFAMLAVRAAAAKFAKVPNFVVRTHIFAAFLAIGALPHMNAHPTGRPNVTTFTCNAPALAAAALP
jgi:hypothetical protein